MHQIAARNVPSEVENCSFVKTVLMLLVVLYHSMFFWYGSWPVGTPVFEAKPLAYFAEWLNSFHIYGFTLVSGYLFYYMKYERRKEEYQKFLPFISNKARRLLVPYIFVSIAWAIPISVYYFDYSAQDVFRNFLLGISPSQLWFLLMLFGVFAISWWLSDFFCEHTLLSAFLVTCLYGAGLLSRRMLPSIFKFQDVLLYMPVFWVGFKMRQYGFKALRKMPSILLIFADIFVLIFIKHIDTYDSPGWKMLRYGCTFILHIFGAVVAFIIFQKIAEKINWDTATFHYVSEKSMTVYLFHQQITYFFITWLNGVVNPYLHTGINFIGTMAISLCIAAVLMKTKATRFLIGEK